MLATAAVVLGMPGYGTELAVGKLGVVSRDALLLVATGVLGRLTAGVAGFGKLGEGIGTDEPVFLVARFVVA
ncbi:hypothetical protein [Paenibacillus sambharensis]|uniref:hypothetical protein n=1 Tax=Paenibacillus sambharensis TaxID=1803190 RepID=UPI0011B5AE2F|nr:hypothetical protein [Paenibacillus sambharensis]